jgi:hypothetical protein
MSRFAMLLLAASAAFAAGTPARAQDAPPGSGADAHTRATPHAVVRPGDRNCLRSTGSLIPPKPGECLPVAGRSYSQEDIRRTGAVNTADALRMLDPSVTVRGH